MEIKQKNILCTCRVKLDSHLGMFADVGFALTDDGVINILDIRVAGNIADIKNLIVLSRERIHYQVDQLVTFGEYCKGAIK